MESSSHTVVNKQIGAAAIWPSHELNSASVLCLTLLLFESSQSLCPGGYSEALHELSPALRWWAEADHLISDGVQPVSFNLMDVSINHLKGHELEDAVRNHGAHSLWNELTARYKQISATLTDKIPDIQYNFDQDTPAKMPTAIELAEEYADAATE